MALSTRTSIAAEIRDNRDQFEQDSDRAIHEMADSLTPVYTADIIAEWSDLPSEFDDMGADFCDPNDGIVRRMTLDLYAYYDQTVSELWAEIQEEHVCTETLSPRFTISASGAMATCDCGYKCGHWECACELNAHDCTETETN